MKPFFLTLLILAGCGGGKDKPSELIFFEAQKNHFNKIINSATPGSEPNWNRDVVLYNNDYPMELTLYQNGKFHYNLPTLGNGAGEGTWTYEEGKVKLFSELDLFDLKIDIHALSENGRDFALKFTDRHGPQVISVNIHNMASSNND